MLFRSKYYDFDLYLLKRPDHKEYCNTNVKYNEEYKLTFCCNKGVIQYYSTSDDLNELMDMDKEKEEEIGHKLQVMRSRIS